MLWNASAQPAGLAGTIEPVSQRPLSLLLESDDLYLWALPEPVLDDGSDLRGGSRRPRCRNDGTNNVQASSLVCVRPVLGTNFPSCSMTRLLVSCFPLYPLVSLAMLILLILAVISKTYKEKSSCAHILANDVPQSTARSVPELTDGTSTASWLELMSVAERAVSSPILLTYSSFGQDGYENCVPNLSVG